MGNREGNRPKALVHFARFAARLNEVVPFHSGEFSAARVAYPFKTAMFSATIRRIEFFRSI
jgi:hypothetical protein